MIAHFINLSFLYSSINYFLVSLLTLVLGLLAITPQLRGLPDPSVCINILGMHFCLHHYP